MCSNFLENNRGDELLRCTGSHRTVVFRNTVFDFSDNYVIITRELGWSKSEVNFLERARDIFLALSDVKKVMQDRRLRWLHISILIYIFILPFNKYGVNLFGAHVVKFTEITLLIIVLFGLRGILLKYFTHEGLHKRCT